MITYLSNTIKVGDRVIFDYDHVENFKAELSSHVKAMTQYNHMVLGGINKMNVVKAFAGSITTLTCPDSWALRVPTNYPIFLLSE